MLPVQALLRGFLAEVSDLGVAEVPAPTAVGAAQPKK